MLDKYTTADLKAKDTTGIEKDKAVLTNDFYAVCEFLDNLKDKLEHLRMSIFK